jgi:hypothetical protein|tara:strand:- start:482 stop:862 length:381 start_codon:yes stop_codon:yes gene_type:complete
MPKCPLCDSNITAKKAGIRLKSLRLSRPSKVLNLIDDQIKKMSRYWEIDEVLEASFLADIDGVNNNVIIESIKRFDSRGSLQKGYGLKYLAGMIKNESKRIAIREEYERKNLDRLPPKLKDMNEKC